MSTKPTKKPSIAPPPRPSTFPPAARRCPIHGFALSPDGRCVRCGTEVRMVRGSGVEPLLAPTPLRTKLIYVLVAACGVGAVLLFAGRGDGTSEPAARGLRVEPNAEPPIPQRSAAELALEETRRQNERRNQEAAAQRLAEEEEERRRARAQVPIVLYGTSWCGVCSQARAYLRAQGIAFVDHDIETNDAARAAHASLNPSNTVPTIAVGNQVLRGFSPTAFEHALDLETEHRLR